MRGTLVETLIGALVLGVTGWFLTFAFAGRDLNSDGYEISARFDRIDGVGIGADVRISGIKVGRVTAQSLDPITYTAHVVMQINNGIELPEDSFAKVSMDGLLGGSYIALLPGASLDVLQPGQEMDEPGQGSIDLMGLIGQVVYGSLGNSEE
ncbi:MAG: outer membrane lipid asymmetry maintenance protein MlaD [Alphaproteobacteria bacterium]|nr:MAG: outer membrane lipid asymmetry maintenance protein MlaD [Alphaproteobacteria bacterium]